jgi:hypothetical protein
MRQLLRHSRPKLRERIAEGQMGDELEEFVRGGLVFLIFDSRDFQVTVPQRQHKRTESCERAARKATGYRAEGKV